MSDNDSSSDDTDTEQETTYPNAAPKGNDYAVGNSGGPGAPEGNQRAVGNSGGAAPEGNMNALKHGVRADPTHLYEYLDERETEWIDQLTGSYVDLLGYDNDDPRIERVKRACIHIYQSWSGEEQILKDGLSEDNYIGISERGEPVVGGKDGHHLHRFTFKRDQEARQILRSLGAFDDPQSQTAEAINNAADSWEQFVEENTINADPNASADAESEN